MILSDRDIIARLDSGVLVVRSPLIPDIKAQMGPSSLDIRLGKYFKIYKHASVPVLDPKTMKDGLFTESIEILEGEPFIIQPGEFVLGVTQEYVKIPNDLVARVEGRSSVGRLGIIIHTTAGFVDAGFEGTITLEITNLNRMPVALYPGMRIGQLAFEQMSSEALVPYGAKKTTKYQGQVEPTESRIGMDPEFCK